MPIGQSQAFKQAVDAFSASFFAVLGSACCVGATNVGKISLSVVRKTIKKGCKNTPQWAGIQWGVF
jgi:hypothetical protein